MDLTKTFRDASYIAIGLCVIGVQRAQVRRQELRKQVADLVKQADARIEPLFAAVEAQIEAQLDAVTDLLPEQTKSLVASARTAGKDARNQFRSRLIAA